MSNNNPIVIGLSGMARSGKDSFCQYLIEAFQERGIKAKRFALADALKNGIREPLKELSGIDILNCTPQDKELVRDYLVAVGKIRRFQSNGQYWTGLLQKLIEKDANDIDVAIISDIRYDFFPKDEVSWVRETMNGKLVHISRYDVFTDTYSVKDVRQFISAPNKDEAENDPKLKAKADYVVEWETAKDLSKLKEHCDPYIQEFLTYLDANKN